jgi:hypothetical protein
MEGIMSVFIHAVMISGFVAVMMLVIEYLNVLSQGEWQERLSRRRWGQYLLAAFLGATPGCLGAFAAVAMYAHGRISMGALVAAMIATSGDESFVMFAMIPRTALYLTLILFFIALFSGALTDRILGMRMTRALSCREDFNLHEEEEHCRCFEKGQFLNQWANCSAARGILAFSLLAFIVAIAAGQVGPSQWNWIRVTLLFVSAVALFITATVPEHFLEDHLWKHVVRQHVPRVFLWTFGSLLVLHLLVDQWQLGDVIQRSNWIILMIAALIGLIPESGPHLIFLTMYSKGVVPFSVFLASSIVQDGHGMLPLLAHSRRAFLAIKFINLLIGLVIGAILMLIGK